MRREVDNWRKSSKYDIEVAKDMFAAERYVYVIFFCHLSIEKMLKAVVAKVTDNTPPKTHDLRHLVEKAQLEPPQDLFEFISSLSEVSIPTRYPFDFAGQSEGYTKELAEDYLHKAEETLKWIGKSLTS